MFSDALDVIHDCLLLIGDGEPVDGITGARAGPLANVLEAFGCECSGFQAVCEQTAHHIIGEKFHAAIGVMDDKKFARA